MRQAGPEDEEEGRLKKQQMEMRGCSLALVLGEARATTKRVR
jgi:hypothetical protein